MLTDLTIQNFIIIEQLEVHFSEGFTAITGETGAGKSVFVGALAMLMGKRADTSLIRQGADRSIIEGHFIQIPEKAQALIAQLGIEGADATRCHIRRELSATGRNRCFINDSLVSLATIEELAIDLLDIHSQHRNLLLGDAGFVLSALDRMSESTVALEVYTQQYKRFKTTEKALKELRLELDKATDERDYDLFRYNELTEAKLLEASEEKRLEEEAKVLRSADEIKASLQEAYARLETSESNAVALIASSIKALEASCDKLPDLEDYLERLSSCQIELADIASDLQRRDDTIEADPYQLEAVESRLDTLNHLFSKYHCATTDELIQLRDELGKRISLYTDGHETISKLEKELESIKQQLDSDARRLTETRQKAAKHMEEKIKATLSQLEIPLAEVSFQFTRSPQPLATGYDKVEFLFAANAKLPLKPVGDIASGGELSRLMLALKALLAEREKLPTILFDEIDTGISGRIADKMGTILQSMGKVMQVIAITHLPQIAARGNHQMHIEKQLDPHGEPITTLRILSPTEREIEIATLLSGDEVTAEGVEAARVLLKEL